jgi:molecular chaperone DnaK (HSP70)
VLPVGGSSHIPLVRGRLEELFPNSVIDVPDPELAVVKGAVTIARERQYAEPDMPPRGPSYFAEPAVTEPAQVVGVPALRPPGQTALWFAWLLSLT